MTLEELTNLLLSIPGFSGKVAYYAFPLGSAPELPFIVYEETSSANIAADNKVYHKRKNLDIELYTEFKDTATENLVETALDSAEIVWSKTEDYLDSERCYMLTYSITI